MKKIKRWFNSLLNDYVRYDHEYELEMSSLYDQICDLKLRVLKLEDENISLCNELYRLENSLDSRIDILISKLNLPNDSLSYPYDGDYTEEYVKSNNIEANTEDWISNEKDQNTNVRKF
jgi:hypothetical protein